MLSYPQINRHAEIRGDESAVTSLFNTPQSSIILWHQGKVITQNEQLVFFTRHEIEQLAETFAFQLYLGKDQQQTYFACYLEQLPDELAAYQLVNVRTAGLFVNQQELGLLFYAQGLFNWHKGHGYCANCGHTTEITNSGHARRCENSNCQKQHFPRIEPAVIFSVINNCESESRILLARQGAWDENRYSVLAGFVEAGESLENAVRREGFEEVGLVIDEVSYVASQPWPFPSSLMLGFETETSEHEIRLIDEEIEKAIWVTASEMKSKIQSGHLKLPYSVSISWHLIDRWFNDQTGDSLRNITD